MSDLTVSSYFDALPDDRRAAMKKLRQVVRKNLPKGFKETIQDKMPSYVVPHSRYADGYHCDPTLPVPFLSMASQKRYIALYHMGLYADPKLLAWFQNQWPKHSPASLDMGKSCIRFKKLEAIPYDLVGKLVGKMSLSAWIQLYEKSVKT